ncbi:hypothetical protein FA13DRAFT_1252825 [Coprinellus micaceus]|uniref:Nucleotide-sugar transporter n=1 Tax=Coprinellus micaceus TaxID=71717 RepID=A0A4Y7TS42_COPMI|nr:hypothetical protein FA13DRAFT_1252825 [Coprinellus micaceus]
MEPNTKSKGYFVYDDLESGGDPEATVKRPPTPKQPSLWGIPLKYLSLLTLAIQNSALTLLMTYSRMPATVSSGTYSAATAVLVSELLKGSISLVFAFLRQDTSGHSNEMSQTSSGITGRLRYRIRRLGGEMFSTDCWKLSIPAILYVVQNNLQYVAASNLPAATFQVTYQMKILTTAIFSVALLRKRLSSTQWFSLVCLALGVGIVQIQAGMQHKAITALSTATSSVVPLKGFAAVTAACFTSGLAGVYFEMVLKNSKTDLWVRNVQLSFFSIIPAITPIVVAHRTDVTSGEGLIATLFHNFTPTAWATILVQVLGGLITALVIKYSDNILKGFATSLSIVISFVASVALFHFHVSPVFMLGSSVVLVATYLYNTPSSGSLSRPSTPRVQSASWSPTAEKDEYYDSLPLSLASTPPLTSASASTTSLASVALSSYSYAQRTLPDSAVEDAYPTPSIHIRTTSNSVHSRVTVL